MAKSKTVYICQGCGIEHSKWQGQCIQCGEWNTLVETVVAGKSPKPKDVQIGKMGGKVYVLSEVKAVKGVKRRLEVGSRELSQVLGGGLVRGSGVLLAGEPGIGKSTLLSQSTLFFASKHGKVLYVCGEESVEQVKMRLERLIGYKKTSKAAQRQIMLMPETDVDVVIGIIEQENPSLVIVDSIQAMVTTDLAGMAGSVGQVRESGNRLLNVCKRANIPLYIVGHVTKGGAIAGPKVLEHMVDVVVELTGERMGRFRLLRTVKNRFGPTDEVGVYEMSDAGLVEVTDASKAFLEESQRGVAGSVVVALMEGTRVMLTEVQALVTPSQLVVPRRVAEGVGVQRVQLLAAVLTKSCRLGLSGSDIFVKVTGGLKVLEPAADLGIALAIASSFINIALPKKSIAVGEVGLLGEVRQVAGLKKRLGEARKMGFTQVMTPEKYKRLNQVVSKYLRGTAGSKAKHTTRQARRGESTRGGSIGRG